MLLVRQSDWFFVDSNKLLEKLGTPQLQHIHDVWEFANALYTWLDIFRHDLWYQTSHSSQAIAGFAHVTALLQTPQGYFVRGPGFGSTSFEAVINNNVMKSSVKVLLPSRHCATSADTLASLDAWVVTGGAALLLLSVRLP